MPAWKNILTVPSKNKGQVSVVVSIPEYLFGKVEAGKVYGQIQYKLGDAVLETVPLVADRNKQEASIFGKIIAKIITTFMY